MDHTGLNQYTPRPNPRATARGPLGGRHRAAFAATLVLSAAFACRGFPPPEERTPGAGRDREHAEAAATPGAPLPAAELATAAEVRAAFETSRDALRRLDADTYLAGYARGSGLVVLDPAGELVGREAFERFVRDWFAAARRRGPAYPLITSGERVYPLDERTAVVVVHWSAPGGEEPHRSLLVYRKEGGVWRITAEQSAPLPATSGQEEEPAR